MNSSEIEDFYSDPKYNVFDLETSIKNKGDDAVGNMAASSFCKDNKIVVAGYKAFDGELGPSDITEDIRNVGVKYKDMEGLDKELLFNTDLLIGHNIKFDLLYLMRDYGEIRDWLYNGGRIWDTQLAQFILDGQRYPYPSLNKVAVRYGGTVKDDRIKAFWDEGVDTEDIPEDMIKEYQADDVLNTELVFLGQLKLARIKGMLPLIYSQMEGLLATTEMEFNGMYFDREISTNKAIDIHNDMLCVESNIKADMKRFIDLDLIEINPYSNDQISAVLFGGSLKYKTSVTLRNEDNTPIRFKTGKRAGEIKTRKEDREYIIVGMGLDNHLSTPLKKKGFYATNDKVLKTLYSDSKEGFVSSFLENLLKLRSLKKDLTTYYIGYADLTWPDGFIHGSLNHCVTPTGRLSSSSPNLQNLTSTGT